MSDPALGATVGSGHAATAEQLAAELADYAARSERALAAEQDRSRAFEAELAAVKQQNIDVLRALENTRRELHLQQRVPIDLNRLSRRAPVRFVMRLLRLLRPASS